MYCHLRVNSQELKLSCGHRCMRHMPNFCGRAFEKNMICSKNIFCENYVMLGKIFAMSGKILHVTGAKFWYVLKYFWCVQKKFFLLCPEKMFWWLPTPSHRSPPTTRQHFVGEIFACSDKLYCAPPPPPIRLGPYAHACGSLYSTVGDHQKLLRTWYTETIFKCFIRSRRLHQKTFRERRVPSGIWRGINFKKRRLYQRGHIPWWCWQLPLLFPTWK